MQKLGVRTSVLIGVMLFCSAVSVCAQEATGRVIGTVTDSQGAVVTEATVTVIQTDTQVSHQTITAKDGTYQVPALQVGTYRVEISKDGFNPVVVTGQHLEINRSLRVNASLVVGSQNTTLEVQGTAAPVETVNPTLGASVTTRTLVDMPLNGRNVLDLALLQPGVSEADNPGNTTFSGPANDTPHFSIAGGREDSVTYLLDGGNNNRLLDNNFVFNPNPDAVAEFRVLESNYTAEYGRNGGGIVSVVTKSGSNNFHGSAFDFLRNDVLDANTFLNNRQTDANGQPIPRPNLKRNQFGATLGGPVVKNKLFFFVSYQGQRQSELQSDGLQTVLTPAELNGDFSQSASGGPDPGVAAFLQANPYFQTDPTLAANAVIDPTKIDPIVQNYIKLGLVPTSATGQIVSQASAQNNNDQLAAKFDMNFTTNDQLQVTLGASKVRLNQPFDTFPTVPGYPDKENINARFVTLAYTKIFSPSVLNVARFTFQRLQQDQGMPGRTLPGPADLGFTGIHPDSPTGPPDISLYDTGLQFGFNYGGPATITNNTYAFNDDVTLIRGKHNWKFGFYFSPYQNNQIYNFIPNGLFTYVGAGGFFTQNVEADFLLGLPFAFQQGPNAPSNIRSKSYAGYGQDEWHINHKLVLTLGLRYEYSSPKYDTQGRTYSIMPGLQSTVFPNAPPGLVFPGDKGAPTGVNFPDRTNFAPRIGFAFDPTGSGKTSIRGGFGVFFDILKAEDNFQFNGTLPFYSTAFFNFAPLAGNPSTQPTLFTDPFSNANGTGVPNPFPSQPVDHNVDFNAAGYLPWSPITTVDPHLKTPYTYQYNLSVQREIARGLTAEADYVGSASHRLTGLQDVNPFILGSNPANRLLDSLPGTQPVTAAIPSYYIIDEFRNVGFENYNSLQLALRKDVGNTPLGQMYFTLGYTLAHNIDNVSGFRQKSSVVPYYNPGQFRANSDLDVRNRITFSGGWDLPFDRLPGPKKLTKGWSLYPILSYRSGFPLDILNDFQSTLTDPGPSGAGDGGLARADLVGTSVQTLNPKAAANYANVQYLQPACTLATQASTPNCNFLYDAGTAANGYGTLGRNAVSGPSRFNLDMSVAKVTPLFGERVSAEFRAEFFNILNNTQFETVDTSVGSSTFGQVRKTYDPRIGQLALRIRF